VSGGAQRYVPTNAIKSAVAGHEIHVLDALGISWRIGRPHIHCPYPTHTDEHASWRWDERRVRAFCSCITGAHDIFNVVAAVERLDFSATKVRVAELLGRPDLIIHTMGVHSPQEAHARVHARRTVLKGSGVLDRKQGQSVQACTREPAVP